MYDVNIGEVNAFDKTSVKDERANDDDARYTCASIFTPFKSNVKILTYCVQYTKKNKAKTKLMLSSFCCTTTESRLADVHETVWLTFTK